jgi:uncharacterized membrane protein YuzA (DUF378 family)
MRTVTWVLVVAAAIRLGIIGFFGADFIGSFLGSAPVAMSWGDRVICGIIGIAGVYSIYLLGMGANNKAT